MYHAKTAEPSEMALEFGGPWISIYLHVYRVNGGQTGVCRRLQILGMLINPAPTVVGEVTFKHTDSPDVTVCYTYRAPDRATPVVHETSEVCVATLATSSWFIVVG